MRAVAINKLVGYSYGCKLVGLTSVATWYKS